MALQSSGLAMRCSARSWRRVCDLPSKDCLTRPWTVTKTYKKVPGDARIMDYACAENNRNPVDPISGKTYTLGSDGKPIDAVVPKK